jgi:hypothetical protein
MRKRNYEAEEERAVQVDSAGVYFCSVEEFGGGGIRTKREKLVANVAPPAEAVLRFTSLGYVGGVRRARAFERFSLTRPISPNLYRLMSSFVSKAKPILLMGLSQEVLVDIASGISAAGKAV